MKVREIISELTYQGRKCTKDCSGHAAGYQWAMARNHTAPCTSHSPSFNGGCDIAATQLKNKKVVRPKVRDTSGRFIRATYRR
jgi:hypothetical protein